MRDKGVSASIDGRLQHKLIVGVGKLRTPLESYLDRFASACESAKESIYLLQTKTVRQSLFGSFQDFLVFKKQRGCRKKHKLLPRHQTQNGVSGARHTPKAGNDNRGIENNPSHIL